MILSMVGGGGMEAEKASGSFRTNSSGNATIDPGFNADLVVFYIMTSGGYECVVGMPIAERKTSSRLSSCSWATSSAIVECELTKTSGTSLTFSFYLWEANMSSESGDYANKTISWRAVKYTD